jgi:hypothetical protein
MDDLEERLRRSLRPPLPSAPDSLRSRIDVTALDRGARSRPRLQPLVWAGVATSVAVVALISTVVLVTRPPAGAQQASTVPSVGVSEPTTGASQPATGVSPPGHVLTPPPLPSELRVPPIDYPGSLSVGEFIERRDAGELASDSITVRGYWSDRSFGHSCTVPDSPPGDLEIRCHDGEFGITEQDEPIGTLTVDYRFIPAQGPAITPFVEDSLARRLVSLPFVHGQWYPPVPVVVRGHVNDPRAAECRPIARELCRDRLVIDEIIVFEPEAVPTPGITPSPSPFPFDDPPPAPFTKEDCAGDVPYSFVGWGRLRDIGLDIADPDEVVYMMVTAGRAAMGGPGGRQGRWVCFAHEWQRGGMTGYLLSDQ